MYKLTKNGLVRIVATQAELERWQALGYTRVKQGDKAEDAIQGTAALPEDEAPAPETPDLQETDPLKDWDADALKQYATENSVDIGNASSQSGIYKKIRDAIPWVPLQTEW